MVVCQQMVYHILFVYVFFYGNDSIELLEIMFDGRAFHFLVVVGRKKDLRMCWTSV